MKNNTILVIKQNWKKKEYKFWSKSNMLMFEGKANLRKGKRGSRCRIWDAYTKDFLTLSMTLKIDLPGSLLYLALIANSRPPPPGITQESQPSQGYE